MWMADKKRFFSKGELIGLKRLARFAAKVPGVANAKIGTVLKSCFEEYGEMGISYSTFKRLVFSLYMKLRARMAHRLATCIN
jgi:hypothetical protein